MKHTESQSHRPGRMWSPSEIAEYFGVHKGTVYGWIRRRELHALKLGHASIRVSDAEMARFQAERTMSCLPEPEGQAS